MKSLICVAALMLASMACAKPHLETLFTITLPGKVLDQPKPSEVLRGDMFYVSTNGGIAAANFSSKAIAWTANVTSAVNPQFGYAPSVPMWFDGSDVYACSTSGAYKLDAMTGAQQWSFPLMGGNNFQIPKCNVTFSGSEVAVMTTNDIYILDKSTGAQKKHENFPEGYMTGFDMMTGQVVVYGTTPMGMLKATTLFSQTKLWEFNPHASFGFSAYYVVGGYVLCTNTTNEGQNVNLVVLNQNNGTKKIEVGAVTGITFNDFKPEVQGNYLIIVAGEEAPRKMTIDLTTGYIVKEEPYSGGGGNQPNQGASTYSVKATDINAEIRITGSLQLQVGPIGGPFTQAANFTPSAGSYNLQYYGQGVVQVGNLQGWTMWQIDATTKSATFLARNEKEPGWKATKGTPITFDGAFIHVLATEIKAEKIVF